MWGVSQNNKMQYFGATVTVGLKQKWKCTQIHMKKWKSK